MSKKNRKKLNIIIFAFVIYIIAIFCKKFNILEKYHFEKILFIVSYLLVGFEILKKAFKNIIRGKVFDENFLMSVATIGAFAMSEFSEAVAVMLFYQVGELFQSLAVDKSRKSISDLMDIRPDKACLINNIGEEKEVSPEKVKMGNTILIKPGEKIPLDGIVIDGETFVDTKALTGESVPVKVKTGDDVLSGSINQDGVIKVKVTKEFQDSTVNKILELVENASSQKSKSENFITKFSAVYTPTVVIIAIILAIFPPIIFNQNFETWIYRALSFLVVSCPCALVISIPLSFFGGIGGAARNGILIKGSNYIETLSKVKIGVFDKTGTLTKGEFKIQEIKAYDIGERELLELVAYSEYYSNHPIAKVIKEEYNKKIDKDKILDIKEIAGHGIQAFVLGKEVLVGNDKLLKENKIQFNEEDLAGTILYIAINKKYSGYILIADSIKEDSKKLVSELNKEGVDKIVMLTGDKRKISEIVAKQLGIKEVYSELLPTDKVEKVKEIIDNKKEEEKVFFVGDGINDSPVLAISDIGIAMGGVGSDSAIEAADIVLMTDEPSKICLAIKLAKKNMRIVKENIIFAISVKILILLLSAIGLANMWGAVFADVGVSIIAILNSLRMLKK